MYRLLAGLSVLMMFSVADATSDGSQSHDSIYSAARNFMQQHMQNENMTGATLQIGKLDSRLKLKHCELPLVARLPRGSRSIGNTTIGVRCTGKRPWSINLSARVDVYRDVLVSVRTLTRGDTLTEDDVELVSRNLASMPHGYLEDIDTTIGMQVKRRILPGTAVTPSMLKKPQLVKRGQQVNIIAAAGNASVSMMGKALAAGAIGELIQVQNKSSKRKIEGIVSGPGEVRVR